MVPQVFVIKVPLYHLRTRRAFRLCKVCPNLTPFWFLHDGVTYCLLSAAAAMSSRLLWASALSSALISTASSSSITGIIGINHKHTKYYSGRKQTLYWISLRKTWFNELLSIMLLCALACSPYFLQFLFHNGPTITKFLIIVWVLQIFLCQQVVVFFLHFIYFILFITFFFSFFFLGGGLLFHTTCT